ncbi:MAG TPA: hypothetical protein VF329_10755 [Gammaproteobacteria bacterium]
MNAAFKGAALYVFSRHRLLLVSAGAIYVVIFALFDTLWALEGKPLVVTMLTFLRAAPFFLPLALFVTSSSVLSVDAASRESAFPRHFSTLPVGSIQLALPFVAYAMLVWAVAWAVAIEITGGRVLLAGPLHLPSDALRRETWFPFLELSLLAWAQALMWTPFRRRWGRIGLLLVLVAVHVAGLVAGINEFLGAAEFAALCAAGVLSAGAVAVRGVALARRGDPPPAASRAAVESAGRAAPAMTRRPAFRSGVDAQVWYEWHLHGLSRYFFLTTVCALILAAPMLLAPRRDALSADAILPAAVGLLFIALVFVPSFGPLFANFASNRYKAFMMPSFFAALPLSSGDFAWAKMRAAARSVALMCAGMTATIVLCGVLIEAAWPAVLAAGLRERYGPLEGTTLLALAAAALPLVAIAATMNTVWLALSDRRAVWHGVTSGLVLIVLGWGFGVTWMQTHPAVALPSVILTLAAVKLAALAWLIHRVGTRRLYRWSRVGTIGGVWLAAAVAVLSGCVRYVPGAGDHLVTAAAAIVVLLPVLGIMGAPLALHVNRCR